MNKWIRKDKLRRSHLSENVLMNWFKKWNGKWIIDLYLEIMNLITQMRIFEGWTELNWVLEDLFNSDDHLSEEDIQSNISL